MLALSRSHLLSCALPLSLALTCGVANARDEQAACTNLSRIKTENSVVRATYIQNAEQLAKATFRNSGDNEDWLVLDNLAAGRVEAPPTPFCRVEVTSTPVAGAEIKSEVWLPPANKWNKRFLGVGNGGPAGYIHTGRLAGGLERGYAVLHSDAGSHSRTRLEGSKETINFHFGQYNKEWATNYAHRAYHVATVVAKEAARKFYRESPLASLYIGCSGGGYEGMGEAQRYPEDYDGIIAGDPPLNFARTGIWQGANYVASQRDPASVLTADLFPLIHRQVMSSCDGIDALKDGVIDDPRRCKVDFRPLQCAPGAQGGCLTPKQLGTLDRIYKPYRHPVTNEIIYPSFPLGAELDPFVKARILNENVGPITADEPGALTWLLPKTFTAKDWLTFDFAKDTNKYIAAFAQYENSNPDMNAFHARGGKLIMFTGWADAILYPQEVVDYFEQVRRTMGAAKTEQFARLFMVPGMAHCRRGAGTDAFGQDFARNQPESDADRDILLALDRWVTKGVAPERIIATKFAGKDDSKRVVRTRPLCAYPKVARWNGKGSSDDAANFVCVAPD